MKRLAGLGQWKTPPHLWFAETSSEEHGGGELHEHEHDEDEHEHEHEAGSEQGQAGRGAGTAAALATGINTNANASASANAEDVGLLDDYADMLLDPLGLG